MIVDFLSWAILAAAILQPTANRRVAALLFAGAIQLHSLFLGHLDGIAYFGSGAVLDLLVIYALSLLREPTRLSFELEKISLVSIMLNAAGWVLWMLYLPPHGYVATFIVLYAYAILVLLQRERGAHDNRGREMDHRSGDLYRGILASPRTHHRGKG